MNSLQKNTKTEILIHLLVWLLLLSFPYSFTVGSGRAWSELIIHFWLLLFLLGIVFYFNYLFAIHKLLFDKKQLLFFLGNLLLVLFFIWLQTEVVRGFFRPANADISKNRPPLAAHYYINFLIFIIPIAFAVALQFSKRLMKVKIQQNETDNIKLQSELQMLKYQLQPHFFFNSLNNIYALVDAEPEKAKQTLHSLSKLMRYLLKSSEVEQVPLADEINFLNQYISLMELRQSTNTAVEVHFPEKVPDVYVAPLLFVSIVENAFKHGVSATQPSSLHFDLTVDEDGQITFVSKNLIFSKGQNDMSGSGIGIDNLKKRLALLFKDQHVFQIVSDENIFIVTLSFKASAKQKPE